MKIQWSSLAFLIPLILLSASSPTLQPNEEVECGVPSADSAMDDLLEQAKNLLEYPLALPNKDGLISLEAGELFGLNTLNRSGPAVVFCNSSAVIVRFPVTTLKHLRARYEWDKKIPGRSIKGLAYARTSNIHFVVTVQVPIESSHLLQARVADLDISDLGDVEVNVSGLTHVSWLSARAIAFMTNVFEVAVTRSLQEGLKDAMNDVLRRTTQLL